MFLRTHRILTLQCNSLLLPPTFLTLKPFPSTLSLKFHRSYLTHKHATLISRPTCSVSASKIQKMSISDATQFVRKMLFVPPGVDPGEVTEDMVVPGSNIVIGPYAGHSQIKEVEFVKSSERAKDCPKDGRPEFAILGRSNVGKSSLINALVRKKEVALTSKKPGKTQLINHFLVNKNWYLVDLPGYGFAKAPDSARMDWSSFTKGYFLNRNTLVAVLLLIDASVPPQKIDLDCANWLGRNDIPITFVFTKCDKMKGGKGTRPAENIRNFQELMRHYRVHPPWILTSSVTGLGRDDLLLHMSQLRNYWDQ
ncbi:GTP-binding protein [Tripterygium wilfordii]|uniref:GTP-binding protein n=1 Tax=Tripterygium wilfordii TaxID=458696 RepID=A0A7J7DTH8_TRIWF|nr:GTP-binding protein At2g22870 [Tripterygium wilfordii]XP_038692632.1 GTP-binding protein At2g22870 [Tripterygium wilfordii]XP_038692643.1 GTP-binding protein At2g22870 [Tripterygium wilfordii]XP_038692652.1 GTP-binding protein At2g22870 [Tripterygium wilfordii]XP_038692660.1 GTP-binding protein At2g22870 [Tripterygium wilfordii]KAF5749682.1 GTP-binding protein [Tripterygium wilfordii]